ncbi:No apical meristem (NAM) protein [Corchorus olitorius]|uniref:No apical meristem (NAM) protein n=1 Tax=Corchorus olitorius TaxID=93759 RepID=A0A1R3GS63_9ROSI|nr:No apical meristem (NAM) protein [Corchorus olitorius]
MVSLGVQFHPSDVELVTYYLKGKVLGKKFPFDTIADLDVYKHAPWDLPEKYLLNSGDLNKWFFFCPIKKYAKGAKLNRATDYGYWKSTGKDRPVMYNKEVVGMIKTLAFRRGKAPHGKTGWVMREYRLEDKELAERGVVQDTYVLCVVFKKNGMGLGNSAQYGAPLKKKHLSDNKDDNLVGIGPVSILSRLAFGGANGPLEGGNDTNAALTCMDAPNVVVVDDKNVHELMGALHLAQVQESIPLNNMSQYACAL